MRSIFGATAIVFVSFLQAISPAAPMTATGPTIATSPTTASAFAYHQTMPIPDGAKVTLATDKAEYFLGENVLVHFIVENTSAQPFKINMGGDYRGTTRSLRFIVTAADEHGDAVPDPDPSGSHMGGLSWSTDIAPGQKWSQSLPLLQYRQFDKPGRYTIRATHDLGWKEEGGRTQPVGETTLTLRMPTDEQAEALVAAMENLPANPDHRAGEKSGPYADFTTLRYAVYLAPLSRRAEAGSKVAVQGIGSIATPQATAELIKLMEPTNPEVALAAVETLTARLPDPEAADWVASRGTFYLDGWRRRRLELAQTGWKEDFAPAVREHARHLLRTDNHRIALAALMLESIGEKEDQANVIAAIDRALEGSQPRRDVRDNILGPPAPVPALLRAARMLAKRGAPVPADPASPGQVAIYLDAIATHANYRPQGWQSRCAQWATHPVPAIRAMAVGALPTSLPPEMSAILVKSFTDEDLGVQMAACDLAAKTKDPAFSKPVLALVSTARHEWVVNYAHNAAVAIGARAEACEIWAARLTEPDMLIPAITRLASIVEHGGSSVNSNVARDEVLAIQRQWQAFLTAHKRDVASGKVYQIGDPDLAPELFGRVYRFSQRNGPEWPPQ